MAQGYCVVPAAMSKSEIATLAETCHALLDKPENQQFQEDKFTGSLVRHFSSLFAIFPRFFREFCVVCFACSTPIIVTVTCEFGSHFVARLWGRSRCPSTRISRS